MEKIIKEKDIRMQRLIFTASAIVYDQLNLDWQKKVNKSFAFSQLLNIVENFLHSEKFKIEQHSFNEDPIRKKIAIMMGMEQIVQKVCLAITCQNSEILEPLL